MNKVSVLPGLPTPPSVFVERLVEHRDQIVNIACVVEWKGGNTQVCSTTMSKADAVWLRYVFDKAFPDEGVP